MKGRRAAVAKGIKMGRKPSITEARTVVIRGDIELGILKTQVAKKHNVFRQMVYKIISFTSR